MGPWEIQYKKVLFRNLHRSQALGNVTVCMWPRVVACPWLHSLKCLQLSRNPKPDMAKPCLSSKEQECVRSFLVYLQRKQSTKLQRGLAWMCADPAVPRPQLPLHPLGDFALAAPVPAWGKAWLCFSHWICICILVLFGFL